MNEQMDRIKLLLGISFSVLFWVNGFSQSKSPGTSKDQLRTDVFVLNTCSPNEIALIRGDDKTKNLPVQKLSINVNRLSAFKIININPLRYNYYINTQFVSQFFDASDLVLGNFTKATSDLPVNEIEVLQVFNAETASSQKGKLDETKSKIRGYQRSLDSLRSAFLELNSDMKTKYTEATDSFTSNSDRKFAKENNDLKNKINGAYATISKNIEDELERYKSIIESLTINNNCKSLLTDIKTSSSDTSDFKLQQVQKVISHEAELTIDHIDLLDDLLSDVPGVLSRLRYTNQNSTHRSSLTNVEKIIDRLKLVKVFASNKSYTIDENRLATGSDIEKRMEIYRIIEFASNEKIKIAESFVLFTSLQLGKLLQNEIVDGSRFQNLIKEETCLDDRKAEIKRNLDHETVLYRYIQDISANLNVLIKYLELNNPSFNSTVASINTNYKALLKFIKTLDFVETNNTKEFTLPSHNGLKNVDIVRYYIEKKDKLTGSIEPYTYDIWVKGGLKVDFSISILMSQLTDFTYNKTALFTTRLPDSTGSYPSFQRTDSFEIKRANNGKYNFAFGGMVNVMLRTGATWVTPGFGFGLAYGSATDSKLQFVGALSFQFGKSERLVAHIGMTAGEVKRLDLSKLNYRALDITDKGTIYQVKGDFATMDPPTTYQFMFKPFFGLSYNLSKKNALNAVGSGSDNYNSRFAQP